MLWWREVTLRRSIATVAISLLIAAPTTADARHGRKHARHYQYHAASIPNGATGIGPGGGQPPNEAGPLQPLIDFFQIGIASIWKGGRTSDGERVSPSEMACAHRTLPLGTVIRVTHARTKRSVQVTVRDRGPYARGKILDLTPAAASALGFERRAGIARVTVKMVSRERSRKPPIYD